MVLVWKMQPGNRLALHDAEAFRWPGEVPATDVPSNCCGAMLRSVQHRMHSTKVAAPALPVAADGTNIPAPKYNRNP